MGAEMKPKNTTTAQRVRELLLYNPEDGEFTWRVNISNRKAGTVAGCTAHQRGYRRIAVDGKRYLAHRLAWLYVTGEWPEEEIDHVDGQTDNNRFINLRPASRVQNAQNAKRDVGITSKYPGVYWHPAREKWAARIRIGDGKRKFLGRFGEERDAALAYQTARDFYHPYAVSR